MVSVRRRRTSTGSPKFKSFVTRKVETRDEVQDPVTSRQEKIDGWDQDALEDTTVALIGAGGLGGGIGEGLVRKGVERLKIFDHDTVETHNLNRQKFHADDIDRNKSYALAKNLVKEGTRATEIDAYPMKFQEAVQRDVDVAADVVVAGPDNDETRRYVSKHYHPDTPVVILGLDLKANGGSVFVQETDGPCFDCYRPGSEQNNPCPGAPAVMDPCRVITGMGLYAVDSLIMDRARNWNLYRIFLAGVVEPYVTEIEKKEDCPTCGGSDGD